MYYVLMPACYTLYILNLYWFSILTKILYKTLTKIYNGINTDKLCHYLCSYTLFINLGVAAYMYSEIPDEKHLYDIIGNGILSISSYLYHYAIYRKLEENKITEYNVPDRENAVYFLNDALSINLRSFFVIITNYYYHSHFRAFQYMSGILHLISIYYLFMNVLYLIIRHDETKNRFVNNHNIIISLPIMADVLFIFLNASHEIAIPFLVTNILIFILFLVQPFYKLNHVGFHILLIIQNYYICLSSRNIE